MMSNKFYEFTKIVDLYDYKEDEYYNLETNEYEQIYIEQPIKKNFKIKWYCDISKIRDIQEYYTEKGIIKKGYSLIRHLDYGEILVKDDYNKLKDVFDEKRKTQVGFYAKHKD